MKGGEGMAHYFKKCIEADIFSKEDVWLQNCFNVVFKAISHQPITANLLQKKLKNFDCV